MNSFLNFIWEVKYYLGLNASFPLLTPGTCIFVRKTWSLGMSQPDDHTDGRGKDVNGAKDKIVRRSGEMSTEI